MRARRAEANTRQIRMSIEARGPWQKFLASQFRPDPIIFFALNARARLVLHPHRPTGAGPSRACFDIPSIPIGFDIRMMARVAGRSDILSERPSEILCREFPTQHTKGSWQKSYGAALRAPSIRIRYRTLCEMDPKGRTLPDQTESLPNVSSK